MKIKIFLFDLDGLLIDSEKVYKKAWKHAFKKMNIDVPNNILESWVGKNIYHMSSDIVRLYNDIEIYNKAYIIREDFIIQSLEKGLIVSKKFSTESLTECKKNGYITGLVTSSPRKRVLKILKYFNWQDKFDYIVTSSDVDELKPEPKPYLSILNQAGLSHFDAVAFEDSLTGYTASTRAGIDTYLIPDSSFNINVSEINKYKIANDLSKVIELISKQS